MQYVDLTHTITNSMPTYPGDTMVTLAQTNTIRTNGYHNSIFQTGMHTGTHIDGPLHMIENSPTINTIDVSSFFGSGVLIELNEKKNPIKKLININLIDSIVLLQTGFSNKFYDADYFTHYPAIDPELIHLLIDKKVKMIGIDTPSPDYSPFHQHKNILDAGIFIIENLTNLHLLKGIPHFEIIALPLNILADSSPARVIARFV